MRLYLLRHGIAEDASAGMSDAERALTDEGRDQLVDTSKALLRLGVKPGVILSSPLVRAVQTAELVAPSLDAPVEQALELQPGCMLSDLERLVRRYQHDTIMIVGHEPDFSTLAARLNNADERGIVLKKGGMIRVDVSGGKLQAGRGRLTALFTPKMFRLIAGGSDS